MSVTATVPRADAAKIFVGEKTSVTVEDCGSFDGVVERIVITLRKLPPCNSYFIHCLCMKAFFLICDLGSAG